MSTYIKENIIKNVVVIILAALLFSGISKALSQIKNEEMNNFLLTISILLVTVSFANFAFTYEKSKLTTVAGKLLSHFATGIFLLLTVLLLASVAIAIGVLYPFLYNHILLFSILLYGGIVLYDFWDILRSEKG